MAFQQPCLIALFPDDTHTKSIQSDRDYEVTPDQNRNEAYTISIDGFSQTLAEPNSDTVATICDHLIELSEDSQFKDSTIKSGRRYRYRFTIPLPINDPNPTGSLLIEAGARFPGIADLRIDFKPVKPGPNGLSDVISLLDLITPLGGHHFITNGTLTRYDIAIDIWGGSVDQVLVFSKRSQKNGVYTDRNGCPQTVYMGTPRSNRTVAYTKTHKVTGRGSLRIERRLTGRCKGHEWPAIADPFRVVQLVHTQSILPLLDGLIPQQFFDSVRIRGLNRVLATLATAQRKAIKKILDDPAQSLLPSTEAIWLGWPHLLEDSGFGFLLTAGARDAPLAPDHLMPANYTVGGF
jgi:hypothetical protein